MLQWLSTAFKIKSNLASTNWLLFSKPTSPSTSLSFIHCTPITLTLLFPKRSSLLGLCTCSHSASVLLHHQLLSILQNSDEIVSLLRAQKYPLLSYHFVFSTALAIICNYLICWLVFLALSVLFHPSPPQTIQWRSERRTLYILIYWLSLQSLENIRYPVRIWKKVLIYIYTHIYSIFVVWLYIHSKLLLGKDHVLFGKNLIWYLESTMWLLLH